jgi:NADH-quinone oxidoreductase subunit N
VTTLNGAFIADPFARIMKALILIGSAATILLSRDYFQRERIDRFEYPILIGRRRGRR